MLLKEIELKLENESVRNLNQIPYAVWLAGNEIRINCRFCLVHMKWNLKFLFGSHEMKLEFIFIMKIIKTLKFRRWWQRRWRVAVMVAAMVAATVVTALIVVAEVVVMVAMAAGDGNNGGNDDDGSGGGGDDGGWWLWRW
uniref:Transmembrane protein n=1 Tax=Lactuca sativa TaxID=4236 RepID=A0A9R1WF59_LACSA|nr:hypothetical protein LSAT_V11C200074180 [Lactuca sativa]